MSGMRRKRCPSCDGSAIHRLACMMEATKALAMDCSRATLMARCEPHLLVQQHMPVAAAAVRQLDLSAVDHNQRHALRLLGRHGLRQPAPGTPPQLAFLHPFAAEDELGSADGSLGQPAGARLQHRTKSQCVSIITHTSHILC